MAGLSLRPVSSSLVSLERALLLQGGVNSAGSKGVGLFCLEIFDFEEGF